MTAPARCGVWIVDNAADRLVKLAGKPFSRTVITVPATPAALCHLGYKRIEQTVDSKHAQAFAAAWDTCFFPEGTIIIRKPVEPLMDA